MGLSLLENNVFLLLFLAAAIHSIFLCFVLLAKSQRERGVEWLGILMIPVALWLMTYLFYLTGLIKSYPHLLGTFGPILYMIGPIYYLFIRQSLASERRLYWMDLLHLLPACYILVEWWPIYFSWSAEAKLAVIERTYAGEHPGLWQMLRANRMSLFILAYLIAAYLLLKKRLAEGVSHLDRIRWLLRFTIGFGTIILLFICLPFVFLSLTSINAAVIELLFVMILAVSIHTLGYLVLGKEKVLPELIFPVEHTKYTTSPLHADEIESKKQLILQYLHSTRCWTNPEFSISHLSTALDIPKHHISQILNEGLQQSFNELICQYRVDEIKERLKAGDIEKYSILGIAKNCGFGSKSSFNRAFKKMTGMTPTEWMKASQ